MFDSNAFDYVNVLDKAADACWLRNQAMGNNVSNVNTPGYKRQDVAFEPLLERALGRMVGNDMDSRVERANENLRRLNPRPYTDLENFSYRIDGNNVDIERENVMLAENQLKYQGLMDGITQEFQNLQSVMK